MLPKNRAPLHPGQLLASTLEEKKMTQSELARTIGMSLQTVNTLINGKRGMTAAVAVALAKVFDVSPELWMNLQTQFDLWHELQKPRSHAAR